MSFSIAQGVGLATLANRTVEQGLALFGLSGAVVLGEFAFDRFEVPESIAIAGRQQMAIHRIPGGARVIDVMGRDDEPLQWAGVMLGPTSVVRERALREIMNRGEPVPLMFGAYFFTVVVEQFRATFARDSYIPYEIVCTVLRDEMAAPEAPVLSAALQVTGDLASAALMVAQLADPPPMPARADGRDLPVPSVALANAQAAAEEAARDGFRRGAAVQAACAASLAIARMSVVDGLAGAGGVAAAVAAEAADGALVADVAGFLAALDACEQMARLGASLGAVGRAEQNAVLGSV